MTTSTALKARNKYIMKYSSFEEYPTSPETNLWTNYTPSATTFRLWSPVAEKVVLKLYEKGDGGEPFEIIKMILKKDGVWETVVKRDLNGFYYTYQVKVNHEWQDETPGIYAKAVGVNGKRAMVLDFNITNPAGWKNDKGPEVKSPNDIIIYELHVRDFTQHPNSGSSYRGKFKGLVETGTVSEQGLSTGIDHLKELGITHVHLLPSFDFVTIDERRLDKPQYNWGYDPQNYNVPEGSYSTDPFHAEVRIKEFKEMVKGFHDNGIGVILDVVYNHTGVTEKSNFNLEVPGYYYRHTDDGQWSDASGCDNETASERTMMRKYMIESCIHWVKEYHIDGFRFDLMGIHDIETMNLLSEELRKINPHIIIYGEGWSAGPSPLPADKLAYKYNTPKLKGIAAFSDDLRDAVKGSVFEKRSRGFVSGWGEKEETVKFGVAGSINHPQIDFSKVNYSDSFWANEPWQSVSYVSCHDNHTLFDKLSISCEGAPFEDIKKMHQLANAIVLTSQGIPFLHAGVEMMRTKLGEHNSYNLPDEINQIDWTWKNTHKDVFDYYKNLIALRKAHPAFRMPTADMVIRHLEFTTTLYAVVGFKLKDHANNDPWKNIAVYYNARNEYVDIRLEGRWKRAVWQDEFDFEGKKMFIDGFKIPPISMLVVYQD